eukprot:TRINITY_DN18973_c0_g1_i1.p1 TRINITY_DN18973_c0_g1~~TRINITY_DN18973_c0_g1_i1.p1  ORF type:complete len:296 (-),score=86.51 TRINITY_DN18973_c0_g1_i1:103-867(-)
MTQVMFDPFGNTQGATVVPQQKKADWDPWGATSQPPPSQQYPSKPVAPTQPNINPPNPFGTNPWGSPTSQPVQHTQPISTAPQNNENSSHNPFGAFGRQNSSHAEHPVFEPYTQAQHKAVDIHSLFLSNNPPNSSTTGPAPPPPAPPSDIAIQQQQHQMQQLQYQQQMQQQQLQLQQQQLQIQYQQQLLQQARVMPYPMQQTYVQSWNTGGVVGYQVPVSQASGSQQGPSDAFTGLMGGFGANGRSQSGAFVGS